MFREKENQCQTTFEEILLYNFPLLVDWADAKYSNVGASFNTFTVVHDRLFNEVRFSVINR